MTLRVAPRLSQKKHPNTPSRRDIRPGCVRTRASESEALSLAPEVPTALYSARIRAGPAM